MAGGRSLAPGEGQLGERGSLQAAANTPSGVGSRPRGRLQRQQVGDGGRGEAALQGCWRASRVQGPCRFPSLPWLLTTAVGSNLWGPTGTPCRDGLLGRVPGGPRSSSPSEELAPGSSAPGSLGGAEARSEHVPGCGTPACTPQPEVRGSGLRTAPRNRPDLGADPALLLQALRPRNRGAWAFCSSVSKGDDENTHLRGLAGLWPHLQGAPVA